MSRLPPHLYIGCEAYGPLYDTRRPDWFRAPPLRRVYCWHFAQISSAARLKASLRAGSAAWPGGYPLFFLTADGGALSFQTVRDNLREVLAAIRDHDYSGWRVTHCCVNWEDRELRDDHTGESLPAAYE